MPSLNRLVFLVGSGRSGTTWLHKVLCAHWNYRAIFEPLHPLQVKMAKNFAGLYLTKEDKVHELKIHLDKVCYGKTEEAWIRWMHMGIDMQTPYTRRLLQYVYNIPNVKFWAKNRVIKFIHANLMVPWLQKQYACPIIYLIRNPYAVVASQMKMGWNTNVHAYVKQKNLMHDFLKKHLEFIKTVGDEIGKLAVLWCIHNKVILQQICNNDATIISRSYEVLMEKPEENVKDIMQKSGFPEIVISASVKKMLRRIVPYNDSINKWRSELSSAQKSRINEVLREFEMQNYHKIANRVNRQ